MSHPRLPMSMPGHLIPEPAIRRINLEEERPLTAADATEALSEYFMYRFEKDSDDDNTVSSSGKKKASWTRAKRTKVQGFDKAETANQIRTLNRLTCTLGEKKKTLDGAQQRLLESTLEELEQRHGHPYFQINLVQIDHQLKPAKESGSKEKGKEKGKRGSKHAATEVRGGLIFIREVKDVRRRSASRDGKTYPLETPQEEVSLTAYYKKSPKPEVNALEIYNRMQANVQQQMMPQPRPQAGPENEPRPQHPPNYQAGPQRHPQGQENEPRPQPPPNHQAGPPRPQPGNWNGQVPPGNNGHPPSGHNGHPPSGNNRQPPSGNNGPHSLGKSGPLPPPPGHRGPGGRPTQGNQPQAGKKNERGPSPKSPRARHRSPSSESTIGSDVFDDLENDSASIQSTNSSYSSRRGRYPLGHGKRGRRPSESPGHYGVHHKDVPFRRARHETHRITDDIPPHVPNAPFDFVEIEGIKEAAYHAGRVDERAEIRDMSDRIAVANAAVAARKPLPPLAPAALPPLDRAPRPRIIQASSGVRRVYPDEVILQRDSEELVRNIRNRGIRRDVIDDDDDDDYEFINTIEAPQYRLASRERNSWEYEDRPPLMHASAPPTRRDGLRWEQTEFPWQERDFDGRRAHEAYLRRREEVDIERGLRTIHPFRPRPGLSLRRLRTAPAPYGGEYRRYFNEYNDLRYA
ncbi:hypothetical protein B0H63DRAFT_276856 [Podospora didyma]|uniref:Uncharacterized protein n=1 Tax=Podospora didyma TaxID=330526 RepID=A0AAE0N9M0_9PEZI|nr:hypothetical protein B0H63DRAFT_276856 [Podospora didyma]